MAASDLPRGTTRPTAWPLIAAGLLLLAARFALEHTLEKPRVLVPGVSRPPGAGAPTVPGD